MSTFDCSVTFPQKFLDSSPSNPIRYFFELPSFRDARKELQNLFTPLESPLHAAEMMMLVPFSANTGFNAPREPSR